jgi:hypothetical protein
VSYNTRCRKFALCESEHGINPVPFSLVSRMMSAAHASGKLIVVR